jgi:hypothetical protein
MTLQVGSGSEINSCGSATLVSLIKNTIYTVSVTTFETILLRFRTVINNKITVPDLAKSYGSSGSGFVTLHKVDVQSLSQRQWHMQQDFISVGCRVEDLHLVSCRIQIRINILDADQFHQ